MSEQSKIAFEAWYDNDIDEPLPTDYTIMGKRYLYMGWKAATAEANKRIAELEREVAELKEQLSILKPHPLCDTSCLLSCSMEADYAEKQYLENQQLKASNNNLREALCEIRHKAYMDDTNTSGLSDIFNIADKALSATPAESLQAFENEVIEKCAKVCDEDAQESRLFGESFQSNVATILAESIRALKSEVK